MSTRPLSLTRQTSLPPETWERRQGRNRFQIKIIQNSLQGPRSSFATRSLALAAPSACPALARPLLVQSCAFRKPQHSAYPVRIRSASNGGDDGLFAPPPPPSPASILESVGLDDLFLHFPSSSAPFLFPSFYFAQSLTFSHCTINQPAIAIILPGPCHFRQLPTVFSFPKATKSAYGCGGVPSCVVQRNSRKTRSCIFLAKV